MGLGEFGAQPLQPLLVVQPGLDRGLGDDGADVGPAQAPGQPLVVDGAPQREHDPLADVPVAGAGDGVQQVGELLGGLLLGGGQFAQLGEPGAVGGGAGALEGVGGGGVDAQQQMRRGGERRDRRRGPGVTARNGFHARLLSLSQFPKGPGVDHRGRSLATKYGDSGTERDSAEIR